MHVVAGVLSDARGRVLLARREGRRELAGLWEFPGGKVEPGETPQQALVRELHEEIGIVLNEAEPAPLIAVPHRMPGGKRILLDAYRVPRFTGRPRGMESQAIAWVSPERLGGYSMPGADRPIVAALQEPETCWLTTLLCQDLESGVATRLEQALQAGARRIVVQVPAGIGADQLSDLAGAWTQLTTAAGGELYFDGDEPQHAAGARLRGTTSSTVVREAAGPGSPLCVICTEHAGLHAAQDRGAAFAIVRLARETSWQQFAELRETVTIPLYALVEDERIDPQQARAHGAQGLVTRF